MDWYVLGNGPFNYDALTPQQGSTGSAGSANSTNSTGGGPAGGPAFNARYSGYPNTSSDDTGAGFARTYNFINASEEAATGSLFRGELDGQKFAPMMLGEWPGWWWRGLTTT